MKNKRFFLILSIASILMVMLTGFWLLTAQPAAAQCGSQASSCKDCHETQAQDPVNADGTNWHEAHAFGDFCYMCHAGNSQSTDKIAAHTGMIAPMSDIKGSCSACHVKDYSDKAQIYATTLGISLANADPTVAPTLAPTQVATASSSSASALATQTTDINSPSKVEALPVLDYIEQYDLAMAARQKTNWSNILLAIFAGILVVVGGSYGITRLGWVNVSFADTKQAQGEYPADLVDMLPELARLKPEARTALCHMIKKPAASEFLVALNHLFGDATEKKL